MFNLPLALLFLQEHWKTAVATMDMTSLPSLTTGVSHMAWAPEGREGQSQDVWKASNLKSEPGEPLDLLYDNIF